MREKFGTIALRAAAEVDRRAVWHVLEPTIRAGETYPLPRDMAPDDALAYWFAPGHETFVAEHDGAIVGTYFMKENQRAGGSHVANCGYMVAPSSQAKGVGRAMCEHSLQHAKARGFHAMQFNFVVSANKRAVGLWQSCGFEIVGRLPRAFNHPSLGLVDAFVMYRTL